MKGHIDLFTGIGGFSIAARWAGLTTEVMCENDSKCKDFLTKTYPGISIVSDVREFDGTRWQNRFLLTGGFPCQDISVAGKGDGLNGKRSGLWREMFRVIRECRPRFVLIENSAALLIRGATRILSDLASIGFDAQWEVISAKQVGAPHERKRLYIVAYPDVLYGKAGVGDIFKRAAQIFDASAKERTQLWLQTPDKISGMDDGISFELYRMVVGQYGNSIVPQVAYQIIKAIKGAE